MRETLLKQLVVSFACTLALSLTVFAQNPIPSGKVFVLSDPTSTNDLSGGELAAPSNNPQIVLSWNLPVENVKDYHIYVDRGENDKPAYLGRTGNDGTMFIWSPTSTHPTNAAYKKGPQDGESYRFLVFALTTGPRPIIGPFSTDAPVKVRIEAVKETPIPTPGATTQSVIVTDTVDDETDLSNGEDIDGDNARELVIRWDIKNAIELKDVHIYVSVNGANRIFLGRTGKTTQSYLSWKKGALNTNVAFRDGPQDGNTYLFSVFLLTESGTPAVLGPYTNAGPVKYTVAPSQETPVPTRIPTVLPTRIPTKEPPIEPTEFPTEKPTVGPPTPPIGNIVSFGDWIEEDGIWKNAVTVNPPDAKRIFRLCIRFKIGDYYYGIYIVIGEGKNPYPIDINHRDAADTIVEAILQVRDENGKWIKVENAIATSSPHLAVKPTPTPDNVKPTPTMQGQKPTPQETKPTPTVTPTKNPVVDSHVSVRLIDVPLDFHRRAADILEDLRGSDVAPNWRDAKLADKVYLFHRPDVEGVAYFEFTLIPHGAIVVSNGKHDEPLVTLNDSDKGSIGDILMREAEKNGVDVAKLYKLDTFGFVAESTEGKMAAQFGNLPRKIKGLDPNALGQSSVELSEIISKPTNDTQNDSEDPGPRIRTTSGPQDSNVTFEAWSSWPEFRDSYSDVYQVLINARMRDVADSWKVEDLIKQNGIVLLPNQTVKLSLLFPESKYVTEGDGAQFVRINGEGNPVVLNLSVENPPAESAEFAVVITHANNQVEKIKFFVPNPEIVAVEDTKEEQPLPGGGGLKPQSVKPQGWGSWSGWTYYYAGNSGDQRAYYQFTYSGCASGCGATAWVMLFGWADNQADEGNAYWSPRWGLYREDGGYGSNAVAPSSQNTGIENITKEINGYVDTFCIGSAGATYPWKMDDADEYFVSRTGTDLEIHYNSVGIHESRLREYARDSIRDRETPAIVGTGWLEHYPLAWAYAWKKRYYYILGVKVDTQYSRYFKLNQGWGGSGDGWESASTWFAGEIEP